MSATRTRVRNTKANRLSNSPKRSRVSAPLLTVFATGTGMLIGFVAALAVALPLMQPAVQPVKALSAHLATDVTPVTSCAVSSPTESGAVLGAATTVSTAPAAPSGGQGGGAPFIQKLVGGQLAADTATVENTGPNSDNTVIQKNTSTTTVTNTTSVNVSADNNQQATTGDATSDGNTTAGNTVTGDATNNTNTSFSVTINN